MKKVFDIERRADRSSAVYHQRFAYETDDAGATVATALRDFDARGELYDIEGNRARPIVWQCSCLQKKCGACAMVVEGVPRAACDTRLADIESEVIHLGPLRKFPVVADLMVDRDVLFGRLKEWEVWLQEAVDLPVKRNSVAYEASRCLQCGCCLEVCPNFSAEGPFGGMAAMAPLARLLSEANRSERARLGKAYRDGVFSGCGKSLACRSICPAGLDIAKLMSRSNAASLWSRW